MRHLSLRSTHNQRRMLLAGGVLTALGVGAVQAGAAPIRVGIEPGPSEAARFARAVLQMAYEHIEQAVQFVELPLRRSLAMSTSGEMDGETIRLEGLEELFPSLVPVRYPLQYAEIRLYVAKDRAVTVRNRQDLQNLRVAYLRGVLALERALQNHPKIELASSQAEMARMLEKDMVDVALTFAPVGSPPLDFGEAIAQQPDVLGHFPLFHYLHVKHRALIPKLEGALRAMDKQGEFARIQKALAGGSTKR